MHTPMHGAESMDTSKLACAYTTRNTTAQKHVILYIGQKNGRDISQVIGRGSASTLRCMCMWGCLMGMHVCAENVSRIIGGEVTSPLLCSLSLTFSDLYIVKTKIDILRAKCGHFWEEDGLWLSGYCFICVWWEKKGRNIHFVIESSNW